MGLTVLQLIYANVCLSPYSLLEDNKGNRVTDSKGYGHESILNIIRPSPSGIISCFP